MGHLLTIPPGAPCRYHLGQLPPRFHTGPSVLVCAPACLCACWHVLALVCLYIFLPVNACLCLLACLSLPVFHVAPLLLLSWGSLSSALCRCQCQCHCALPVLVPVPLCTVHCTVHYTALALHWYWHCTVHCTMHCQVPTTHFCCFCLLVL
jgi:hypothetical protein